VVTLTIDRPERANALTPELCDGLREALEAVDRSNDHRVIVLRGAGGRAFCGGFDLGHVSADVDDTPLRRLMRAVREASCPVVAVLHGAAIGAGFELACTADVRIAASGVRVGVPAVSLGVGYSLDGIRTMVRSHPGAARLLITGQKEPVDALPGFALTTSADELEAGVRELVHAMALASPKAVSYTRRAIHWTLGDDSGDDRSDLTTLAAEVMAELGEARSGARTEPTGDTGG